MTPRDIPAQRNTAADALPSPDPNDHRIVVGVDGSAGSKSALRWAMTQAQLTGAKVEAITCWQDPVTWGYTYGVPALYEAGDLAASAEKYLGETITEVAGQLGQPADVLSRVVQGHPAEVLTEAATGAGLLVVGSRGHGTFAGIMLGSVSQHCVQHAPCPVVVVPQ
jgi:nucleotide-binding universal stress UspA family protein